MVYVTFLPQLNWNLDRRCIKNSYLVTNSPGGKQKKISGVDESWVSTMQWLRSISNMATAHSLAITEQRKNISDG